MVRAMAQRVVDGGGNQSHPGGSHSVIFNVLLMGASV